MRDISVHEFRTTFLFKAMPVRKKFYPHYGTDINGYADASK